jgi:two-component system phosphate regulon sensor histidine kinase PhoR
VKVGFRGKLFLTAGSVAVVTALATTTLLVWALRRDLHARIEDRLLLETRLVADMLVRGTVPGTTASLDREADRLAGLVQARVTFIGHDGRLVGDSDVPESKLPAIEEHLHRPEVVEAARSGVGRARRYSSTIGVDLIYTAVPVKHPQVAYVRLAAPEADVQQQVRALLPLIVVAILAGVVVALAVAWFLAARMSRRVREMAAVAGRYAAGDFVRPPIEYGDDELGTVARALDGVVQDLGHRLTELARNRARMEAILAGMVEGVLVVDALGRVQVANEAAQRMLHVTGSAEGRRYTEIIRHPDVVAQLAAALRGEDTAGAQLTLGPDSSRVLFARAAPARGDQPGGAALVLHDITELKRADQVRRDFVANVSHELRTPLTAIRGYVEALLDESPSDEAREFLQIIFRHTTRMERLVGDLLRLARLDARQETPERSQVDLAGLVDGVLGELSTLIDGRGTTVVTEIDPQARLITDSARLHDILRNLLENAVNYAPEGGRVRVSAAVAGGATIIDVADNGPGIPPGDLERVFERFYRVDKSRARNPGGTGIGLAIVKHLVELLGGTVRASNARGGGAVFTLTLPGGMDAPARQLAPNSTTIL